MKIISNLKLVLATVILTFTSSIAHAQAPTWSAEQTAVWEVVAQSWVDETAQNGEWPASYIVDNVVSWSAAWPSPRNKEAMVKWSRFGDSQTKTLQYENTPVAIAVRGNTAVVTYTNVTVSQRADDKPERSVDGMMETLVLTDDGWKFLGLTSFDMTPK